MMKGVGNVRSTAKNRAPFWEGGLLRNGRAPSGMAETPEPIMSCFPRLPQPSLEQEMGSQLLNSSGSSTGPPPAYYKDDDSTVTIAGTLCEETFRSEEVAYFVCGPSIPETAATKSAD